MIKTKINDDNINIKDVNKIFNILLVVESEPFINNYKTLYLLKYKLNFQQIKNGTRIFLIILLILTIIFILITNFLLYYFRFVAIIKASTLSYMFIILFGLLLGTITLLINNNIFIRL